MSTVGTAIEIERPVEGPPAVVRPYAPSWVNHLTAWIDRLPGPSWAFYLVAMGVAVLMQWGFAWAFGMVAPGELSVAYAYYGAALPATVWLMHHLDGVADRALDDFRPLLDVSAEELARWRYELTVIPARPAAIITVVVYLITYPYYVIDPVAADTVGYTPAMLLVRGLWEGLVGALVIILAYHSVRQLRLVARIHARATRVALFEPAPIYAFSTLTSRTAVGLILLSAPSVFVTPSNAGAVAITVAWVGSMVVIGAAIFVLPLWGMHRQIAAEKERLEAEVGRRLVATMADVHAAVDERRRDDADALNKTLATLITERDMVAKLSTWPWSASAFWGLASAVVLPIGLWFVTRVLERVI
jgi:hypothetical protein